MSEKLKPEIEERTIYDGELDLSTLPIVSETKKEDGDYDQTVCYSQSRQFCPRCELKDLCISALDPNF